jgi:ADP-heptose:LPS heptosyltransferase
MYPYFCKVKPAEFFIREVEPSGRPYQHFNGFTGKVDMQIDIGLPESYIVVHTTGGQAEYRTYKHMDIALKGIAIPIIQIGGPSDYACQMASIDLRGKLSFRETAWVMKRAKAAVCVDSFPMHLAGALGIPLVAIFGPAPARVTGPIGDPDKIICLEPNKLDVCPSLTNCWGEKGCKSPCINTINPLKVRQTLLKLISNENKE